MNNSTIPIQSTEYLPRVLEGNKKRKGMLAADVNYKIPPRNSEVIIHDIREKYYIIHRKFNWPRLGEGW